MPILTAVASAVVGAAFAVWAIRLCVVDFREHRLPDVWVLPAYPVALAWVGWQHPGSSLEVLGAAALTVATAYVLHRLTGLGLGDVKLIGVCVILLAPSGALATAFVCIAMVGGVHALIHAAIVRDLRSDIPFGPAILTGTALGMLTSI